MRSHLRFCTLHREHALGHNLSMKEPDWIGLVTGPGCETVGYSHGLSSLHDFLNLVSMVYIACLVLGIDVSIEGQTYFLHREQIGSRLSHCRLPDLQDRQARAALSCSLAEVFPLGDDITLIYNSRGTWSDQKVE